jgi:hypothetical protein
LDSTVNVANAVKQFATHALKQLSESDRISLKANLNILFDEKYKNGPKDEQFGMQFKQSNSVLRVLPTTPGQRKK